MNIELAINILIIALLIPVIIYTSKLNRNLRILRDKQNSLSQLVQSLNEAAHKAENTIPHIKTATAFAADELKNSADYATETKEELSFVIKRAENLTERLENVIYASRFPKDSKKEEIVPKKENIKKEEIEKDDSTFHSEAEIELLQALRSIK